MEAIYLIVAVAAIVAIYFLLFRQAEPAPPPRSERAAKSTRPAESKRPGAKQSKPPPPAEPESPRPAPAPDATSKEQARAKSSAEGAGEAEEDVDVSEGHEDSGPPRPSVAHVVDIAGLRRGLAKSRSDAGFFGRLKALLGGKKEISPALAGEIEEILLASDVGVETTATILERIREGLSRGDLVDEGRVWEALRAEALRILRVGDAEGAFVLTSVPTVVIMVGVNGSGKTTTIGKLATKLYAEKRTCVLAAADTFRAAAVQQLIVWGDRIGSPVVRGKDGADPSSVVFEAIKKGKEARADVVLVDTAGRLHTKANLMAEMQKIVRTAAKAMPGAPHEVLLVIDATNGQNALAQAREFKEALPLTGIVLTKLDGTAKGGVILGICDTLKLPVRFIGLGERSDDLRDFSPEEFVEALLGKEAEASAA